MTSILLLVINGDFYLQYSIVLKLVLVVVLYRLELPFSFCSTVGQKTVPMFGCFAKIEVEQIKKIS